MRYVFDDGGRALAGYKGGTGDCCVRAFAIATGRPYEQVYEMVNNLAATERRGSRKCGISNARTGVYKNTAHRLAYECSARVRWTPTMFVGSGCKVHLADGELPMGRLVVAVSKHYVAVVDGIVHDIFDPTRNGSRCVYGYWNFSSLR